MVKIQGAGDNREAKVNSLGRLEVAAFSESAIQDAADLGNAYTISSTYAATAGQEVIYIQNTSASLHFHVVSIAAGSTIDTLWTLFKVTSSTAAGGTALTERNRNLSSADNAPMNSFGDATVTGGLTGNTLDHWYTLADTTPFIYPFRGGLRLDENDAIALTVDANGTVAVTISGFFS